MERKVMNNQHEIAMIKHWNDKAIHSKATAARYYRTYAKRSMQWAEQALDKANTEPMQRNDNAVVICLCLLAVTLFVAMALITTVPVAATISYCGSVVFFVSAVAYTWQEYKHRSKKGGINAIA